MFGRQKTHCLELNAGVMRALHSLTAPVLCQRDYMRLHLRPIEPIIIRKIALPLICHACGPRVLIDDKVSTHLRSVIKQSATIHLGIPWCCLLVNQSRLSPNFIILCGLNLVSLCLSMSWRLDSPGSIALTIHLHRRLVLAAFGSTSPSPPYFLFKQHSFKLTLVRVSCSFPNY